ncbi:hypothetical protein ABEG18_02110 [Alsobacter sp. KACC 23698]|uniref:Uncharacterized protein n=1 Tax=Alsobacter sp. KACC 23698 TaxID=3149229 RepID=A0AAU7JH05_9HYPH
MMRAAAVRTLAAGGALLAAWATAAAEPALLRVGQAAWAEKAWPFPRDGWPPGRAFACEGCGDDLVVYVRPKLGFCNCATGVTDDAEVDGVTDLDLIAPTFRPAGPGAPIRIGALPGRARRYVMETPDGPRSAVGVAVSQRCDVVVAVALSRRPVGDDALGLAVALLESEAPMGWIRQALDHP